MTVIATSVEKCRRSQCVKSSYQMHAAVLHRTPMQQHKTGTADLTAVHRQ